MAGEADEIRGTEHVILVDEQDRPIGVAEKVAAHQNGGQLHRAFSVFLLNDRGQMLLQRRAATKYHFGGLWTNACCSHPRQNQGTDVAARDRLQFEMGIDAPLEERFAFVYRAHDPVSGLTEHEYDHVFVGRFDGTPSPHPQEVSDWRWMEPTALLEDVRRNPQQYTPWFKLVLERLSPADLSVRSRGLRGDGQG